MFQRSSPLRSANLNHRLVNCFPVVIDAERNGFAIPKEKNGTDDDVQRKRLLRNATAGPQVNFLLKVEVFSDQRWPVSIAGPDNKPSDVLGVNPSARFSLGLPCT